MDHSECKNIIEETCGPSADFRNSNFHSKELQSINKKKKRSQASRLKRKIKRQQEAIAKFQKKQGIQWFLKNAAFYYVKSFLNFLFIFLSITMNKKKILFTKNVCSVYSVSVSIFVYNLTHQLKYAIFLQWYNSSLKQINK